MLKVVTMIVLLAFVGIITGCQEGHARHNNRTSIRKVALEPTVTGFWQAKLVYVDAD
jgi:hypothetical protein